MTNFTQNQTVREYLQKTKEAKAAQEHNTNTEADCLSKYPKSLDIRSIRVSELKTIPNQQTQRLINRSHVKEIADNFDRNVFAPVTVSCRDGEYYILDGQHRVGAVKLRFGDSYIVECKVIYGLTAEQEADLFVKINTSQKMLNASDVVKGKYYANDPQVVAIKKMCDRNGIEFGFESGSRNKQDGRIIAVKTLCDTYEKLGKTTTERIIKLLNDTWNGNAEGLSATMIKAMAVIMSLYSSELNDKIWVKKLSPVDPSRLIAMAKNDLTTKANIPIKIARIAVTNYYNKGKGANALPYRFGV